MDHQDGLPAMELEHLSLTQTPEKSTTNNILILSQITFIICKRKILLELLLARIIRVCWLGWEDDNNGAGDREK